MTVMAYIRECVVTTVSPEGVPHVAPLGIIGEGNGWVVAPFRPSTTLANLSATGVAVANYTDDARIFAGCVTGRCRDWPLVPVPDCPVPRLSAALAHDVLRVERVNEDETRPRFFCTVEASASHGAFTGLNRAKAAVLEAAILVSRLHILPPGKIEDEIAYLRIAVEKTAGPDEHEAFGWLLEAVIDHLAKIEREQATGGTRSRPRSVRDH